MELEKNGHTIRATPKSYEVLYRSRGFKPVQSNEQATELPAYDDLVKRDIKSLLDDGGVDYDERATKKELYELLGEGN